MSRLASISLLTKFTLVKGSRYHDCVQANQPRTPHTFVQEINLAPLELIHLDLCEMIDNRWNEIFHELTD